MKRFFAKIHKLLWLGDDFDYERSGLVAGEAGHSADDRVQAALVVAIVILIITAVIGVTLCTLPPK